MPFYIVAFEFTSLSLPFSLSPCMCVCVLSSIHSFIPFLFVSLCFSFSSCLYSSLSHCLSLCVHFPALLSHSLSLIHSLSLHPMLSLFLIISIYFHLFHPPFQIMQDQSINFSIISFTYLLSSLNAFPLSCPISVSTPTLSLPLFLLLLTSSSHFSSLHPSALSLPSLLPPFSSLSTPPFLSLFLLRPFRFLSLHLLEHFQVTLLLQLACGTVWDESTINEDKKKKRMK